MESTMNTSNPTEHTGLKPLDPPDSSTLPHALVFFLTRDQRTRVLRILRSINESRETALLHALEAVSK